MTERIEVQRVMELPADDIFAVLCDPDGHVAIDASGMLQGAQGAPVSAVGDTFLVHMDRESLGDMPMGQYDVTVVIEAFESGRDIAWSIIGTVKPPIGHVFGYRLEPESQATRVTSYYDWSRASQDFKDLGIFPVISEANLKATLGILERAVRRGYPRG
ncbi:hypothetical protein [Demetria terragena]|uniref:hypothetical protein n=1 Tax=Demetria terragena TaxID=63959 RepID=UPI000381D2EA|nr:hypothetical protein [Demetria terragena]